MVWRSILGSILGLILVDSGTISEKPHRIDLRTLHTAVGRDLKAKIWLNMGPGGYWLGTGIAPPSPPSSPTTPGTPPYPTSRLAGSPHELGTGK